MSEVVRHVIDRRTTRAIRAGRSDVGGRIAATAAALWERSSQLMDALMGRGMGMLTIVLWRGWEMTIGFGYDRLLESARGRIISSWG